MQKGIDYPSITVVFYCHDGKGNYLFNKRGQNCRDEQGRWDCGGGGLDVGDSVLDTLTKEIKEEYCTDVLEHEFLGYRDTFREQKGVKVHWVGLYFKVHVDREKVRNGEPEKFDDIAWHTLDTLPTPLHSLYLEDLETFRDKL